MSPLMIRIVLTLAIKVLTHYRDQLTQEQKDAFRKAVREMPTPDEQKAAELAAKPWPERFKLER